MPQGYHSARFLAAERGYFAREGLNVTLMRGFGSADIITRFGAGAAEIGFGDAGAVVKINAENPGRAVVNVFQYFDRTLAAVITLNGRGMERPAHLVDKRIAAQSGYAGRVLFSAFAQANGFAADSVTWVGGAPPLRGPMLFHGEAEAITAFTSGPFFALRRLGSPPADIRNVSLQRSWRGHLRQRAGAARGSGDSGARDGARGGAVNRAGDPRRVKRPRGRTAAVRAREALSDPVLEYERVRFIFRESVLTPAADRMLPVMQA